MASLSALVARCPRVVAAGAGVLALLLLGGLVAVVDDVRDGADRTRPEVIQPQQAAVVAALSFLVEVTDVDATRRHRAVARWASPERLVEFMSAMDADVARFAGGASSLVRQPQGWRLYYDEPTVKQLLVWSLLQGSGRTAGAQPTAMAPRWQVSAVGVHLIGGQWRVFSYDGTQDGPAPGDPRLRGFTLLPTAPQGAVPPA